MSGYIIPIIILSWTIITGVITLALPEERCKPFIRHKALLLPTKEEIITFKLDCHRDPQASIALHLIQLVQILGFHHGNQNTNNPKTPERHQVHI
jgi:hypothetical protein